LRVRQDGVIRLSRDGAIHPSWTVMKSAAVAGLTAIMVFQTACGLPIVSRPSITEKSEKITTSPETTQTQSLPSSVRAEPSSTEN